MAVYLDPVPHIYHDTENALMKFISVTTVLGKYHEPFDEMFFSEKVAKREGKTQQQVLAEWKKINTEANIYGTMVHEILERYLLAPYRMYSPRDDFESRVITSFAQFCLQHNLNIGTSSTMHPERVMSIPFKPTQGMAGTSDIIEDIPNNQFNVWDFKTNKDFRFESKYNKWLLFPVNHLNDSQFNTYALQLSMYGVMYERETGKKCNRLGMMYWEKTSETWALHNTPYLKKDAENIIDHYKLKMIA